MAIVVTLMFARPDRSLTEGELRCEDAGAVIVNVAGEDYAVNSLAGWRFLRSSSSGTKTAFPKRISTGSLCGDSRCATGKISPRKDEADPSKHRVNSDPEVTFLVKRKCSTDLHQPTASSERDR